MSPRDGTRDDATETQVRAADPQQSTWLSANAGSGKTRVLTDRVARMLLMGVDPGRILCLTYTRAAATEMQNRLFRRLGAWAMRDDGGLARELADLGIEGAMDTAGLASARTLFARAIEVPGGLRIQTIHSFCASLLRRFPLEAGVSPRFVEMDDRAAKLLRDRILDEMADGRAPEVMADLATLHTGESFGDFADEVSARRGEFEPFLDEEACRAMFGVPPGLTETGVLAQVFLDDEADWLPAVTKRMQDGSTNDSKSAKTLARIRLDPATIDDLRVLEGVVLNQSGANVFAAKVGSFPTKETRGALGALQHRLDALMHRVEATRPLRIGVQAARRTAILHRFARAFLPLYAERKAARGLLDFDDLILSARALLETASVAQWVLYRLDGGIDHILVDEAQDTSPSQWAVIESLTAEFTAGIGARRAGRTIFVVGDKKQSIYSFQGADVAVFDTKRDLFGQRLTDAGTALQARELAHSFRSSPAILRLVDQTFAGAGGLGGEVAHIAHRTDMPGRIEVWAPMEPRPPAASANWFDPVDLVSDEHHTARLGRAVADRIARMIAEGQRIPVKGGAAGETRAVHAGDILILVQRRSEVFAAIIAACKARGLPIAGADRLRLGAELAVKDLTALLAFLATPEDDLSLAAALRSPLFGWTEAALYDLAQRRTGFLWQALRETGSDTLTVLMDLRDQTDFLRPYDLIERILTRHRGRTNLIARLGEEAADGIDELLSQALAYEAGGVPSLTGFLGWLGADEVDVKRQTGAAGSRIRVMTVHGAKGLEAPVVILPDTAKRRPSERGELLTLGPVPVWKTPAKESPDPIREAREATKARDAAESLRLLYVAMTRAQSWLIVAAAGDIGVPTAADAPQPVWYRLIRDAMEKIGAVSDGEGGLVHAEGDWPAAAGAAAAARLPATVLPDWIDRLPPAAPRPPQPLRPSGLGGAKIVAGDRPGSAPSAADDDGSGSGDVDAVVRGSRLHLLLEHLPHRPAAEWPALAEALLPGAPDAADLLTEARGVLSDPSLRWLFGPGTMAEVGIVATLRGRRILGSIDRLVVTQGGVLAVDFKSNAHLPRDASEVPEGILRQMGAYAAALAPLYPGQRVETAILWTRGPLLMPLDPGAVSAALGRAAMP